LTFLNIERPTQTRRKTGEHISHFIVHTRIHLPSRTNAQNDALLHKLIHTKLLSNQDVRLPPAKKRKALEGRILELTGDATLGKGESRVREAERNKAAKRVREGIAQKQKERRKQELEEVSFLFFSMELAS
jgi:hypothetical protein